MEIHSSGIEWQYCSDELQLLQRSTSAFHVKWIRRSGKSTVVGTLIFVDNIIRFAICDLRNKDANQMNRNGEMAKCGRDSEREKACERYPCLSNGTKWNPLYCGCTQRGNSMIIIVSMLLIWIKLLNWISLSRLLTETERFSNGAHNHENIDCWWHL